MSLRDIKKYKYHIIGSLTALAGVAYLMRTSDNMSKPDLRKYINNKQIALNVLAQNYINNYGFSGLEEATKAGAKEIETLKEQYLTRFNEEWSPPA